MTTLLPLPILLPILGAAISILGGRTRSLQRAVGLAVLTANVGVAVAILVQVDRDGIASTQAGGWDAPLGITLVADRLTGIMLCVSSLMLLAVLVFAIGQPGAERGHVGFQSAYLVLAAGVSGAFLAGDLFNLFVAFEMMLTASYVLMTLGGAREQVRSGMTYVVISLISSALFVAAIALLYTATGTVNLADLSQEVPKLPTSVQSGFAVLLVVVFGIKAAIFPLFSWLPDSYPTAPSPVTAIFAGLLTKVGVYALIRTQTLIIPEGARPGTLLLWLAGLTMVIGVLGAIAQDDVKRILSFNIVSHIGFMIMGLGLFTAAGIAAAILYAIHHIVAKTAMFLTGGLIEHTAGSSRLSELGDLVRRTPMIATLFLLPALALAGLPPLSGFVPKVALVGAGLDTGHGVVIGVSLAASVLSLYSLLKIWSGA
ncbi:MAG TPA: proton-conducting transporter membrane subunit, partial [Acidimicrobiales bacterium]